MKTRLRYFNLSVGQIDENLLRLYKEKYHYDKFFYVLPELISKALLDGRECNGRESFREAERYAHNMNYQNIAECLEDYMRSQLSDYYEICENCVHGNLTGNDRFCIHRQEPVPRLDSCEKFKRKKI